MPDSLIQPVDRSPSSFWMAGDFDPNAKETQSRLHKRQLGMLSGASALGHSSKHPVYAWDCRPARWVTVKSDT
jgi:hypothetical protein